MKKLIILIAALILSGNILAQNTDKASTYLGTNDVLYNAFQNTLEGLRMVSISAPSNEITNVVAITRVNAGTVDTLSRLSNSGDSLDTMTGYFSNWFKFTIAADDTIEFSQTANFTEGQVFKLLPGETFTSGRWSIADFTNLYFRRYVISGATGSPNVRIIAEGN